MSLSAETWLLVPVSLVLPQESFVEWKEVEVKEENIGFTWLNRQGKPLICGIHCIKKKKKKIINRCFIRHVLFSETKRDHFVILKIWIHFFFFFFFLFHFVVVLSDYRRRIQSDNNINNRYMVYMNNSNVTYMKSFLWIYSKSLTNKKIAKKHCRYLFQRFIRIPESSWTVNILLLPNFL